MKSRKWNREISINRIPPEFPVGGITRGVIGRNMRDPLDMRAEYDISEEVQSGRDGNPKFESLSEIATGLLADLERELYGDGGA